MAKLEPTPGPMSAMLELISPLTGNELKLLLVIADSISNRAALTINALAAKATLDRTTVMRLMATLGDKEYLEVTLTDKGWRTVNAVQQTLGTASQDVCYVKLRTTLGEAVAISDRAAAPRVNQHVQNATESVVLNPDSSAAFDPNVSTIPKSKANQHFASPGQQKAKEYARYWAGKLNDGASLGLHITAWYAAITHDEHHGNHIMEAALMDVMSALLARQERTGRHQGPAITARIRELFKANQVPLNVRGAYGNHKD